MSSGATRAIGVPAGSGSLQAPVPSTIYWLLVHTDVGNLAKQTGRCLGCAEGCCPAWRETPVDHPMLLLGPPVARRSKRLAGENCVVSPVLSGSHYSQDVEIFRGY